MTIRALRPYIIAVGMTLPGIGLRFLHPDVSPLLVALLSAWPFWAHPFCSPGVRSRPDGHSSGCSRGCCGFYRRAARIRRGHVLYLDGGPAPRERLLPLRHCQHDRGQQAAHRRGLVVHCACFCQTVSYGVSLPDDKRTDVLFLGLATIYALFIPLKGSLTWVDGVVLLGIYIWYICIIARRPVEEEEPEGPAALLAHFAKKVRLRSVILIFLFRRWSFCAMPNPSAKAWLPAENCWASTNFCWCSGLRLLPRSRPNSSLPSCLPHGQCFAGPGQPAFVQAQPVDPACGHDPRRLRRVIRLAFAFHKP